MKLWNREESFYKFTFSNDDLSDMKGRILSYNEGREVITLFAKDMIELAATVQLKELRVVTKSGTYSLMSVSPNWPKSDAIISTFNSTDPDDNLLHKKYLTIDSVERWEEKHNRWGKVANKLGLKYQRFPPDPSLDVSSEDFI